MPKQTKPLAGNAPQKREVKLIQTEAHSGPLPHPQILHGYNQIVPGAAERILSLAENQQAHRHRLESQAMQIESRNSLLGIISAFVLSVVTVLTGGFVAYSGAQWPGVVLGSSGLASVVGVFIYGTQQRRKEREQKAKLVKN
jgi:uncharacterized membrane protein